MLEHASIYRGALVARIERAVNHGELTPSSGSTGRDPFSWG